MLRIKAPVLVLTSLTLAGGCFSERSDDPTDVDFRGDTLVEIRIDDNFFSPANATIDRGARVRWIKASTAVFHTVTPEGHTAWQRFATDVPNDTFEVVLQAAGDFPYFCEPHRTVGMVGTITVQ
jgi:plastocyanin